jgi:hypothetical protein
MRLCLILLQGMAYHQKDYFSGTMVVVKTFRHRVGSAIDWTPYKERCDVARKMAAEFNKHLATISCNTKVSICSFCVILVKNCERDRFQWKFNIIFIKHNPERTKIRKYTHRHTRTHTKTKNKRAKMKSYETKNNKNTWLSHKICAQTVLSYTCENIFNSIHVTVKVCFSAIQFSCSQRPCIDSKREMILIV